MTICVFTCILRTSNLFVYTQVNMVELRKHEEHLRDTVFYTALGESLLFQDFESALAYASECRRQGTRLPPLYTLKGERVDPSGALNPAKGQGNIPDDLPYVFGQLPSTESEDGRNVTEGKQIFLWTLYCSRIIFHSSLLNIYH